VYFMNETSAGLVFFRRMLTISDSGISGRTSRN
jgi:hypothetical protein